jgi:hypothetical protein
MSTASRLARCVMKWDKSIFPRLEFHLKPVIQTDACRLPKLEIAVIVFCVMFWLPLSAFRPFLPWSLYSAHPSNSPPTFSDRSQHHWTIHDQSQNCTLIRHYLKRSDKHYDHQPCFTSHLPVFSRSLECYPNRQEGIGAFTWLYMSPGGFPGIRWTFYIWYFHCSS